jgi:hypothetical protein
MGRGKSAHSLALIEAAVTILEEIQPATIRAVCYRLFTQSLIESMEKRCTNRVSTHLVWAREHDALDWDWVVDETREPEYAYTWDNPEQLIQSTITQYRKDRWQHQPRRVEVWSEKGTVRGTLRPVLDEYGVTFRVMHGYASATAVYQAARESEHLTVPLLVLYVGDWDPSGLHMSNIDLPSRLREYGARIELRRVALSGDDVTYGDLPSFAAETKQGDARWRWYTDRYGPACWELDALSPVLLRDRVREAITATIDIAQWERDGRAEALEQESMREIIGAWRSRIGA